MRGNTDRTKRLREVSVTTRPYLSLERALLETEFYRENLGKYETPVLRALNFKNYMEKRKLYIGEGELIVGEKGEGPQATPTYPEICAHTAGDMRVMNARAYIGFRVTDEQIALQEREILPFWRGRSTRDMLLDEMTPEWKDLYAAGMFTEFMEQRAPGHTVADGKIYEKGFLDFKREIEAEIEKLDYTNDPEARDKRAQLRGMAISCDAIMIYGRRYAECARALAEAEADPARKAELNRIAENCDVVPAHKPRTFAQALQMYWFVHVGITTETNTWDSFSPGRLDQYLNPFYLRECAAGTINYEKARELIECLWIKFNNQPAPPKVGITLKESATYTDFANINTGGINPLTGEDGVNDVSYIILDAMDEMRLVQPNSNVQISDKTPDEFLLRAVGIAKQGWGQPAFYNTEELIQELLNAGKSLADARFGGCSGCVETGAHGREAYILTGYLNVPKALELTLNDGFDAHTGKVVGLRTGDPASFKTYDELYEAFLKQLKYVIDVKIRGNNVIEKIFAAHMPSTFMSVLTDGCRESGRDYNAGGAKYNTRYIQAVGIGTIADALAAIKHNVYDETGWFAEGKPSRDGEFAACYASNSVPKGPASPRGRSCRATAPNELEFGRRASRISMPDLLRALKDDFEGHDGILNLVLNHTPKYGNDDEYADGIMNEVFTSVRDMIRGRRAVCGGTYQIDMLPTTCHVYFGSVMGASANGRRAEKPVTDGISPEKGADRKGPTAVLKSCAKMDHTSTGGTLLNQKFTPASIDGPEGTKRLAALIRGYFKLGGHHIQFNVVDRETLREAQRHPDENRDLIVRVAGYSDYFNNLERALQDEIIDRTEQAF